jgi:hypothetical protein
MLLGEVRLLFHYITAIMGVRSVDEADTLNLIRTALGATFNIQQTRYHGLGAIIIGVVGGCSCDLLIDGL